MSKLGIIVPYRNRYQHLEAWTREVKHYLDSQDINYNIIVVEQDDATAFNRGMLCNIGFIHAVKRGCTYVVFHDVDMIPVTVDYSPNNTPVHLFDDQLPFDSYFGGMTMFPVEDFKKINGFSNMYWGWGYEDDDLRYRCALHNIDFGTPTLKSEGINRDTAIFNGKNSIARIPNNLKFSTDFTIEVSGRLDHVEMDPKKVFDQYTLLSIKGNELNISYNSFNRFSVQLFDKGFDKYIINSDVFTNSEFNVRLQYIARTKTVQLFVNDSLEASTILKNRILDYSKQSTINIGADSEETNYYHGAIDSITLYTRKDEVVNRYLKPNRIKYIWVDHVKRDKGTLDNIDVAPYEAPGSTEIDSTVPYRRKGDIYKLPHPDNGYVEGRWRSDLTRWNQLRYNNEVKRGVYNNSKDGLKDCEYILHSKKYKDKVLHLNIGI